MTDTTGTGKYEALLDAVPQPRAGADRGRASRASETALAGAIEAGEQG